MRRSSRQPRRNLWQAEYLNLDWRRIEEISGLPFAYDRRQPIVEYTYASFDAEEL